jgi:hypothetical protein
MRALLLANSGDADAGFVGQRFEDYDFSFTTVQREYPHEWPSLDGIDLVLYLGSTGRSTGTMLQRVSLLNPRSFARVIDVEFPNSASVLERK